MVSLELYTQLSLSLSLLSLGADSHVIMLSHEVKVHVLQLALAFCGSLFAYQIESTISPRE